jgi:hypothetical protein
MTEKVPVGLSFGCGVHEIEENIPFFCPENREQVADGIVYLRPSCRTAVCVKWRGGHCRMCSTRKSEQLDLLEGRS